MTEFYDPRPSELPRLGDVVMGFHNATLKLGAKLGRDFGDLEIAVTHPKHLVILTPCCSIENDAVSLAPLIQLPWKILKNPFFAEDVTRINRLVPPEKALTPDVWEKLPLEDRQQRIAKGNAYVLSEVYAYSEHDLLPKYELHRNNDRIRTGHYMVDFKSMFRVESKAINRGNHVELAKLKILQLTVQARQELRDKLAAYFARVPEEDRAEFLPA